ncbi:hypothetical protein F4802DRAFT_517515 [Xylaria palmicola]|nr:hypothetical protein F4802DRAFT_517515 [Xylaria palmicola]
MIDRTSPSVRNTSCADRSVVFSNPPPRSPRANARLNLAPPPLSRAVTWEEKGRPTIKRSAMQATGFPPGAPARSLLWHMGFSSFSWFDRTSSHPHPPSCRGVRVALVTFPGTHGSRRSGQVFAQHARKPLQRCRVTAGEVRGGGREGRGGRGPVLSHAINRRGLRCRVGTMHCRQSLRTGTHCPGRGEHLLEVTAISSTLLAGYLHFLGCPGGKWCYLTTHWLIIHVGRTELFTKIRRNLCRCLAEVDSETIQLPIRPALLRAAGGRAG